nr:hypothetical protein Iba_chr03dCG11440 [Ipomoea batatas]GMC78229.1 hypothetical protein Iba_chr03fCG6000 [Ipomoea batatas]GME21687.1 hypothetical protein Iba_scaffold28834.2CG0260 [Ipomoea batatas]
MYKKNLSPFPLFWILSHIFHHPICCFPATKRVKNYTSGFSNFFHKFQFLASVHSIPKAFGLLDADNIM